MPRWDSFESFITEATQAEADQRQGLVDALLQERGEWPWVEEGQATFIYVGMGVERVALNLDTIKADPPFAPMTKLEGTTFWYVTHPFDNDDLLDYMLAVDDPMTPLATETNVVGRISRHWRVDGMNPTKMMTAQMTVSVLRMNDARPFPNWKAMARVPRGTVYEHAINSSQLQFSGRKLWVYTPPGYDSDGDKSYPVLIFQDGQWGMGPLQMPYIADTLIKHQRLQPLIIAMVQSGDQKQRIKTFVSNDKHYLFLLMELMPFLQMEYRVDSARLGIGGVAIGAIAAAHAVLKNPAVFSRLAMISPPLGKGVAQKELLQYAERFEDAPVLPRRIFQSVGRHETRSRFYLPARMLNQILAQRGDLDYQYVETGSGHGLVGFRSILPEALAWIYPDDGA
jgi:enterochelin esterase-like enzyme